MIKRYDLKISSKTAKQCKELIHELFDKFKESDFPIYENVSKPTVEMLGRAHETVRCINIHISDSIILQTEIDSMNQIQAIVTGTYKLHPDDDQVVVINLIQNATQINLREI